MYIMLYLCICVTERGVETLERFKQQVYRPTNNVNEFSHELLQTILLKTLVGAYIHRKLEQPSLEQQSLSEEITQPSERERLFQVEQDQRQRQLKQHENVLRSVCRKWIEIIPVHYHSSSYSMLFQYRIKKYTTDLVLLGGFS